MAAHLRGEQLLTLDQIQILDLSLTLYLVQTLDLVQILDLVQTLDLALICFFIVWLVLVRILNKDAFLNQGAPGPPSKEGNRSEL